MYLVICPGGDPGADQAADWAKVAFKDVKNHHLVVPAPGAQFQIAAMTQAPIEWIFYFGHGSVDRWLRCAPDGGGGIVATEALVTRRNLAFFENKKVCAIACRTTKSLGPAARVGDLASTYIGSRLVLKWSPANKSSVTLCERLCADLVAHIVRLGRLTSEELAKIINEHREYWLDKAGRGDSEAKEAYSYLNSSWSGLEVLP